MVEFRKFVLALIALGFIALLEWLTNRPFALYCYGALMVGVAAHQAGSASVLDVPVVWSSAGGKLFLALVGLFSAVSPLLIGVIWFRWWWGLAGYALGGLGTALSSPILPGNLILRLFLGAVLCMGSALWLAR